MNEQVNKETALKLGESWAPSVDTSAACTLSKKAGRFYERPFREPLGENLIFSSLTHCKISRIRRR